MLIPFIVFSMAVLLAYTAQFNNVRWGLKASFSVVFIFLALRYNYGNDYIGYHDMFKDINMYSDINVFDNDYHAEIGWLILCRVCEPIGFFGMVAITSFITCCVYYSMIVRYVPRKYYWLAVFLYCFTSGFLLTQSSMMRQTMAMNIFILAIPYLIKKDFIRYLLLVFFASTFHTSAILMLPICFVNFIDFKVTKKKACIIFVSYVILYFSSAYLKPIVGDYVNLYFKRYVGYLDDKPIELGTGLGLIYMAGVLMLLLLNEQYQSKNNRILFKLVIIGYFFNPLGFMVPLLGRIGMYLFCLTIVVYPIFLNYLKNPIHRYLFLLALIFMTLYGFYGFFQSDIWKDAFGTYTTIFSHNEY